jgi:putative oxidoreductase
LRRLYSTFAGGWPGVGLLLMRLVVGSALVLRAGSTLWRDPPTTVAITSMFLLGSGILLLPGLWTPIAGTLVALVAIAQILARVGDPWVPLLLGTIGGALAMLGPGLWSADARLFGWKRVEAPPRKSSYSSH